ncbi:MAG: pyridoxal phosphate-dependent aminotransferase [Alphaproteobacteria bacterium]
MQDGNLHISRIVSGIQMSAIKKMAMRSAGTEGAVSLAWGVPSFETPLHIRAAVERELESDPDIGKYSLPDGLTELRELAAARHRRATGIDADPDENLMITAGNTQGINALLHVLIDPGDEVIVTDPGFASHIQQTRLCGGTPVYWAMDEARGWALDVDALGELVTARTKAIVLVSPSNPTGKIFSENELRRIGDIALARNLIILVDDPYSHFTYDNRDRFFNLASVEALKDNLVYMFTFSKAFAMSGWRLAYMVAPAWLKQQLLKVHDSTIICAPRISQVAGIAALKEEVHQLRGFEEALAGRRRLICERLDAVSHVFQYVRPEGAYYVFPKILATHSTSVDFAIRLLDEAGVAVTPGSAFGPAGEHHLRMAYCVDEDTINLAFDRIEVCFGRTTS